jgi:hypothetical protein
MKMLLRVLVLAGGALLIVLGPRPVQGQGGSCQSSYTTSVENCDSYCTTKTDFNDITASNGGSGLYSPQFNWANCGGCISTNNCPNPNECGSQAFSYYAAVMYGPVLLRRGTGRVMCYLLLAVCLRKWRLPGVFWRRRRRRWWWGQLRPRR